MNTATQSAKYANKVAILGWGSLLWDRRPEMTKYTGTWNFDGPALSLEYCRISDSRHGALTLVRYWTKNVSPVCWTVSTLSLDDSRELLRQREGCRNVEDIEFARADGSSSEVPIVRWLKQRGLYAAVWTGLKSNFESKTRSTFNIDRAIGHLDKLDEQGQRSALEYFLLTPACIKTPLRNSQRLGRWISERTTARAGS